MLKGDLSTTSLATVLADLAAANSTGALVLNHPDGDEAQLFMRSGLVCGLTATNRRSDLGAKLVSSGELAPEALSEALEAQRTDLSAWNLAELLVHLGYVERDVVQEFVVEQVHEALWDLMRWTEGRWKFRKSAKTREDIAPATVVELLESLRERGYEWESIASVVDSPEAIPMLSARGDGAPETTLDSDAWSMLCKIDGMRSVAELAADCGYTLFEAGQVLVTLVDAGLVDITDEAESDDGVEYGTSALASALGVGRGTKAAPAEEGDDALSRLTRLATEVTNGGRAAAAASTTNPLQLDVMAAQQGGTASFTVPVTRRSGESFASSMGRVSGALADVLGPAPEADDDGVDPLLEVRKRQPRAAKPTTEGSETDLERKKRVRAAAAAELAEAQAAAEALRPDHDEHVSQSSSDAPIRLVDLHTERARVAANDAEEAARHAHEGAAREAAEQFARAAAEQAAQLAQEQAERASTTQASQQAAEIAAQQAAEQAAANQAAAEQAAAEQAAAEQAAAEQAAAEHAAANQAAAEQAAAEQAAAEQAAAAQAADEQAAAEHAAAVQAAAEFAAAQLAAEQSAVAEAARVAQEQAQLAAAQAAAEVIHVAEDPAAAAQRSDEAAAATAMLAELHHTAAAISVVPDPEPEPEPEPEPQPEPAYAPDPFPSAGSGEGADTAALLRELSSLGTEDDGPSLGSAPSRPRPQQADKKVKKKIGLFGL